MRNIHILLLLFLSILFCACNEQEHFSSSSMKYADLLRIRLAERWTEVEVLDAWHSGKILHRYILVPRDVSLPDSLPKGTLVRTPLERVVAFSSVHGGLFCDLECADRMIGICDVEYIQLDSLRQRISDQRLLNMGSSMKVNHELMVSARPDALFVSPFENAGYGVLSALNIPLIECADYMETSALGRAEWMKFYGLLLGCEEKADSLFEQVEHRYLQLCDKVRHTVSRPTLICDLKQGSAWYVPGGNSYIGRLFVDAGAHYIFEEQSKSGSVALSFENVYVKGCDADCWVIKYGSATPYTYGIIASDYAPYMQFSAWRNRKIYGCNTFSVPFYEEIPFHPDLLLMDMVKIFHPEILPNHVLKYYQPLSE